MSITSSSIVHALPRLIHQSLKAHIVSIQAPGTVTKLRFVVKSAVPISTLESQWMVEATYSLTPFEDEQSDESAETSEGALHQDTFLITASTPLRAIESAARPAPAGAPLVLRCASKGGQHLVARLDTGVNMFVGGAGSAKTRTLAAVLSVLRSSTAFASSDVSVNHLIEPADAVEALSASATHSRFVGSILEVCHHERLRVLCLGSLAPTIYSFDACLISDVSDLTGIHGQRSTPSVVVIDSLRAPHFRVSGAAGRRGSTPTFWLDMTILQSWAQSLNIVLIGLLNPQETVSASLVDLCEGSVANTFIFFAPFSVPVVSKPTAASGPASFGPQFEADVEDALIGVSSRLAVPGVTASRRTLGGRLRYFLTNGNDLTGIRSEDLGKVFIPVYDATWTCVDCQGGSSETDDRRPPADATDEVVCAILAYILDCAPSDIVKGSGIGLVEFRSLTTRNAFIGLVDRLLLAVSGHASPSTMDADRVVSTLAFARDYSFSVDHIELRDPFTVPDALRSVGASKPTLAQSYLDLVSSSDPQPRLELVADLIRRSSQRVVVLAS